VGLGARPVGAGTDNPGLPVSCGNADPKKCCFLSETRIATPHGEIAIDELRIGDLVMTVSGKPKPVKWIGRNHHQRQPSQAWSPDFAPIKVGRFALDNRSPCRDLYLSPAHAIYLHGLLIPVGNLINGRSIVVDQCADAVALDYYHIELEEHDVVLAEGAPAETFGGTDHSGFDNAEEYEMLYGSTLAPERSFAPIVSLNGGRQALRSRLRSAISPVYDVRQPLDLIRDHLDARACQIAP
jgi:Hint domain